MLQQVYFPSRFLSITRTSCDFMRTTLNEKLFFSKEQQYTEEGAGPGGNKNAMRFEELCIFSGAIG